MVAFCCYHNRQIRWTQTDKSATMGRCSLRRDEMLKPHQLLPTITFSLWKTQFCYSGSAPNFLLMLDPFLARVNLHSLLPPLAGWLLGHPFSCSLLNGVLFDSQHDSIHIRHSFFWQRINCRFSSPPDSVGRTHPGPFNMEAWMGDACVVCS